MSQSSKRPLSEDLSPEVSEARLARQWAAVTVRTRLLPSRRGSRWVLVASMAAVLVAAIVLFVRVGPHGLDQKAHLHGPDEHEELLLADGSRITLEPKSRIRLPTVTAARIHLVLEAGAIELDIPPSEVRTFIVSAANHELTTLGTAFGVRVEPKAERQVLYVSVTRGTLEVTRTDGSMRRELDAGESWSTTVDPSAPQESREIAGSDPNNQAGPAGAESLAEGAKDLLARATEARVDGHLKEALAALDRLRKRYRSDARAGLAAFELGRLRLDELGDPAGALEALNDAIALAPEAPFREDAEARRVDALDALGDVRCVTARTSYLERFPKGIHARWVRSRCDAP